MQTIPTTGSYPTDKLRSDSLNLLRFPLAVVVLTAHIWPTDSFVLQGTSYATDAFPLFQFISRCFSGFLRGQSVPIYYFISGYVFFAGVSLTKDVFKRKLQNRIKTLLVPYIIWNLMAAFVVIFVNCFLFPLFSSHLPRFVQPQVNFSFAAFLSIFWDASHGFFCPEVSSATDLTSHSIYPQDLPLWFLRELIIVVLFTPLIGILLKHIRSGIPCLLGITWFACAYFELGYMNQLLTAFFFFSWGAYISINRKDMLAEFGRHARSSVVLYALLGTLHVAAAYCLPDACPTIKRLNIIVGLYFGYNLAAWLLKRGICRPNPFLASSSFFIYVSHWLVFGYVISLCRRFVTVPTSGSLLASYLLTVLLTVALLLAAFAFMQRHAPALLRIMTGRK